MNTFEIPRKVTISAVTVPVLIVGQFALVAIAPVAIVAIATARRVQDRTVRALAALLTGSYATALVLWAAGPDRAPSLSKDLHPVVAAAIVVSAVALLGRIAALRRSQRGATSTPRPDAA